MSWGIILTALVKDVVLPEAIRAYKQARDKKNGAEPTDDEVRAEFDANTAEGIAKGEAFLARMRSDA